MSASAATPVWHLTGKPVGMSGFAQGFGYPSMRVVLQGSAPAGSDLAAIAAALSEVLPAHPSSQPAPPSAPAGQAAFLAVAGLILDALHRLQRAADLPVDEAGRAVPFERGRAWLLVPCLTRSFDATANALAWLVRLVDLRASGSGTADHLGNLPGVLEQLGRSVGPASNTTRLVRAAHELGMPVHELPGQVFQFGQGRRARWMDSSFTDATPQIGAGLARNKRLAANVLRQAGIPVPPHRTVKSAQAAVQAALALGYPVVVKPADLDGGVGVAAGLVSPEEVSAAYEETRRHSANVLVEKHVEGRDYRVVVLHGEVIWAIERVPGGVTGDGRHTVRQLLEQANADPRRGGGGRAALKRIALDEEARALLRREGLAEDSVPPAGRFVRLRRAANVATGGTPVPVFDQVHPDNRRLAVRAAEALRLDLAGVDLLIPDIGRSWKEVGAAICEVNGQPNLGQTTTAHLYGSILRRLVPGDGRIPIAVVLGAGRDSTLARDIEARLRAAGLAAGCSDREGVRIAGDTVTRGPLGAYAGGLLLMRDRSVAAAVLSVDDGSVLKTGLPCARFDVLALAGPHVAMTPADTRVERPATHHELLNVLLPTVLPGCDGKVLPAAGVGWSLPDLSRHTTATWADKPLPPARMADAVVEALLEAERRHAAGAAPQG